MTQNQDQDYLNLFKPKAGEAPEDATLRRSPEPAEGHRPEPAEGHRPEPVEGSYAPFESEFEPPPQAASGPSFNPRTIGLFFGGGCLLLLLTAVVAFAFFQVFLRRGGDDDNQGTPTPTRLAALAPSPTVAVVESPLIVPLVSSADVRVPVALPERLSIGEAVFAVQAVNTPAGAWPKAPITGDAVTWAYGSVINYILGLAPTPENSDLLSALQAGDPLSVHMSTGLTLNFSVEEVMVGVTDTTALFEQVSPRLTLGLLAAEPAQRTVVSAAFIGDEVAEEPSLASATTGVVGTVADLGLVRVTVIDAYQAVAEEAGLPSDAGYLLVDFAVENVGPETLKTEYFQTFVSDATGERYPLTIVASQFAKYGLPTDPLAPGETVIGSAGYLVPRSADSLEGQVQWLFNPLPGSDNWLTVPLLYTLPPPTATPEPPPPVGFARVTVDSDNVFINWDDNVLDVSLEIENISEGLVQVTEDDISLDSWPDGTWSLQAPAPPLPWTIEPGERRLFQLQFELPTVDSALLTVLGYTFAINNLGVE